MSNLVIYPNSHIYLSGMWLSVAPRTNTKEDVCFKRDWSAFSKYDNHLRLTPSQHNCEDLCDHFMSARILALIMDKIFI